MTSEWVAAAQAALAGEHACIYAYGVIGAHVEDKDAASQALNDHRRRRDNLASMISADGTEPVASSVAYDLEHPVTDASRAAELGEVLEQRLGDLYVDLIAAAQADSTARGLAAEALVNTTAWHTRWAGETSAFPGLSNRPGAPLTPQFPFLPRT